MKWFRRAPGSPSRLGILAGSFNPPTVAHLALARAAIGMVDEVVLVLPQAFPHKEYSGANFEQRIGLLCRAVEDEPAMSVAASEGGLFIEIARECREAYGPGVRLSFLCGRDAAERIVGWDYGDPGAFVSMLDHFDLLVASRAGSYLAPAHYALRIRELPMPDPLDDVSSSAIRERIERGEPWEFLAPPAIAGEIRRIYGGG